MERTGGVPQEAGSLPNGNSGVSAQVLMENRSVPRLISRLLLQINMKS